jgi:hypothetical protein
MPTIHNCIYQERFALNIYSEDLYYLNVNYSFQEFLEEEVIELSENVMEANYTLFLFQEEDFVYPYSNGNKLIDFLKLTTLDSLVKSFRNDRFIFCFLFKEDCLSEVDLKLFKSFKDCLTENKIIHCNSFFSLISILKTEKEKFDSRWIPTT